MQRRRIPPPPALLRRARGLGGGTAPGPAAPRDDRHGAAAPRLPGVPGPLTVPSPAARSTDPAADPRGPVDPAATGPRPPLVTVAAAVLAAMGLGLVAVTLVDLVDLVAGYLAEDHVDGMTALLVGVMAAVAAAIMLAVIGVGLGLVVVAARIVRRIRWAWIEGCAAAVVAALLASVGLLSGEAGDSSPRATFEVALGAASLVGALVVVAALVVHRPWFGRLYLPRTPSEAPFWLRRDRFP